MLYKLTYVNYLNLSYTSDLTEHYFNTKQDVSEL